MANCQVFSASDYKVETCSDTIPYGFFGWDQPPLRSVFGEPDYLGQWKTQYRALVLEASLTQEHNAVHLNAIFFERVLQDRSHPVPHSDLIELGLQDHHLAVDHVPDEAKVFFCPADDESSDTVPEPLTYRPDPNEVPNLSDPPSSSDADSPRRRDDPRRPLRHHPAWVETLWNLLQDEGATELLEEGPIIYLGSY